MWSAYHVIEMSTNTDPCAGIVHPEIRIPLASFAPDPGSVHHHGHDILEHQSAVNQNANENFAAIPAHQLKGSMAGVESVHD